MLSQKYQILHILKRTKNVHIYSTPDYSNLQGTQGFELSRFENKGTEIRKKWFTIFLSTQYTF